MRPSTHPKNQPARKLKYLLGAIIILLTAFSGTHPSDNYRAATIGNADLKVSGISNLHNSKRFGSISLYHILALTYSQYLLTAEYNVIFGGKWLFYYTCR